MPAVKITERYFRNRIKAELRRYGALDLEKFKQLLSKVPLTVAFDVLKVEARELAAAVRDEIVRQPFSWPPLSEKYLARKRREGKDERMLIATRDYLDSIGIQQAMKGRTRIRIRVGVPDKVHEPSGLNYNALGRIHEFGTQTIPARPHWDPAYQRWKRTRQRKLVDEILKRVNFVLRWRMRRHLRRAEQAERVK